VVRIGPLGAEEDANVSTAATLKNMRRALQVLAVRESWLRDAEVFTQEFNMGRPNWAADEAYFDLQTRIKRPRIAAIFLLNDVGEVLFPMRQGWPNLRSSGSAPCHAGDGQSALRLPLLGGARIDTEMMRNLFSTRREGASLTT
jgi:hypothetical protein